MGRARRKSSEPLRRITNLIASPANFIWKKFRNSRSSTTPFSPEKIEKGVRTLAGTALAICCHAPTSGEHRRLIDNYLQNMTTLCEKLESCFHGMLKGLPNLQHILLNITNIMKHYWKHSQRDRVEYVEELCRLSKAAQDSCHEILSTGIFTARRSSCCRYDNNIADLHDSVAQTVNMTTIFHKSIDDFFNALGRPTKIFGVKVNLELRFQLSDLNNSFDEGLDILKCIANDLADTLSMKYLPVESALEELNMYMLQNGDTPPATPERNQDEFNVNSNDASMMEVSFCKI